MEEKFQSALKKILKLASDNQEFGDELRKGLNINSNRPVDSFSKESAKLDHIYEYCIMQILQQQARLFYAPFKDLDIYETLVNDYVRMEDFRRKNNFGDYSLAVYQQIEAFTNFIYQDSSYYLLFKSILPLFVYPNKSVEEFVLGTGKYLTEGKERLFQKQSWAKEKMKFVVYVFAYLGKDKIDQNAYIKLTNTLNNIYLCRNTNHRNTQQDEKSVQKLEGIKSNTSWAYFEFNNALTEYIRIISNGRQRKEEIFEFLPKEAVLITKLPGGAFVTIDGHDDVVEVPQNLFGVVRDKNQGDKIQVIFVKSKLLAIL